METTQEDLLKKISSFLEEHKIPYMITGAWSTIYYGRPRASHDIDFVVEIHEENFKRIIEMFGKLPEDFLIQSDSILEAVNNKSMFQVLHLPTMLKFDFWLLTDTEFDKSRFLRRQKVEILGQMMEIASMEDTIIQKLSWYQDSKIEKHLVDAAFVFQIQKEKLNHKYLKNWVKKLDLKKYYDELAEIDLEEYL